MDAGLAVPGCACSYFYSIHCIQFNITVKIDKSKSTILQSNQIAAGTEKNVTSCQICPNFALLAGTTLI